MYVSNRNSVNIELSFSTIHGKAAERALIDSGATDNFIDQRTAKRLHLTPRQLKQPRLLYNVDGTENLSGRVTSYCDLLITRGKDESVQRFFLANLGKDRIILGFPWLHHFNPQIDWSKGGVTGTPFHVAVTSRSTPETPKNLLHYAQILG